VPGIVAQQPGIAFPKRSRPWGRNFVGSQHWVRGVGSSVGVRGGPDQNYKKEINVGVDSGPHIVYFLLIFPFSLSM